MSNLNTIPTPWNHQLRRFIQMALPFIGFAATILLTAWFWQHEQYYPDGIREVDARRIDVASDGEGTFSPLTPDQDQQIGLGGNGKSTPVNQATVPNRS